MIFSVWILGGETLYHGPSWPMARAAIDHALLEDKGQPAMMTYKELVLDSKAES